jgi:hypothetical protein
MVRLVSDGADRLHATWQTYQSEGYGQAVYYSRSLDAGESWSLPQRFDNREQGDIFVEWPYVTPRTESELYAIYVNGAIQGRDQRISFDGGETWGDPTHILSDMTGINGFVVPLVDANSEMHLVVNMRTRVDEIVGIYYSRGQDQGWSKATPVAVDEPYGPSAHQTAAAMRLGNEIHVVWCQLRGGEIWHVRGLLQDIAPSPTLQVSAPPDAGKPGRTTPTRDFAHSEEADAQDRLADEPLDPGTVIVASRMPILIGTGSALLLIVSVFLWHARNRSR